MRMSFTLASEHRRVLALSFSTLALVGGAPATAARVAPDPPPTYATLASKSNRVVSDTKGILGTFISTGSSTFPLYIWDLQIVKLPDGTLVTRRYELQTSDDEIVVFDAPLSEFPAGSVDVDSMADVYGSANTVYTDVDGNLLVMKTSSVPSGRIDDGGAVLHPGLPGSGGDCAARANVACSEYCYNVFGWQFGRCVPTGGGSCACPYGPCPMIIVGWGCAGSCPSGQSCEEDGGSCGCR